MIPSLLKHFHFPHIAHRTLLTAGIGESLLADLIQPWEENLPPHVKIAYLPNYGMVRLRLTIKKDDEQQVEKEIDQYFVELQHLVKSYLVTNVDEPLEKVIGKLLMERKQTLSTAESCSGGYIAHLITSVPGSSAYFEGSLITYSYAAKEKLLQVDKHDLIDKGAVSEEVVRKMADGAMKQLQTNYAIAVSGIMGPDGGTPDKPVGTVWVAVASRQKTVARKLHFRFDRERNIQLTSVAALNMLRQLILETEPIPAQ